MSVHYPVNGIPNIQPMNNGVCVRDSKGPLKAACKAPERSGALDSPTVSPLQDGENGHAIIY